jgi:uncharacterized protein YxeA
METQPESNSISTSYWPDILYGIIFLLIIIIVFVLITIYVVIPTVENEVINRFSNEYRQGLEKSCESSEYLNYYDLPQTSNMEEYNAELSKALLTFAMNVSNSNCLNLGPLPKPQNFEIVEKLISTVLNENGKPRTDTYGYIFYSEERDYIVVVYTGTFYLTEWYEDLQFESVPVDGQLRNVNSSVFAHEGFLNIYNGLKTQLRNTIDKINRPGTQLFITGHSLGGALTSICAMDFATYNPIVYTFASPRVFNNSGAILLDSLLPHSMRIFNTEDIVPDVPLPVGFGYIYTHTGINNPFTLNLGTIVQNHIDAYIQTIIGN